MLHITFCGICCFVFYYSSQLVVSLGLLLWQQQNVSSYPNCINLYWKPPSNRYTPNWYEEAACVVHVLQLHLTKGWHGTDNQTPQLLLVIMRVTCRCLCKLELFISLWEACNNILGDNNEIDMLSQLTFAGTAFLAFYLLQRKNLIT